MCIRDSFSGYATDNTGFFIQTTGGHGKVQSPAGVNAGAAPVDTNGNFISQTVVSPTETDWTDTAGHLALKVFNNGSNIQHEWRDSSGNYTAATTTTVLLSAFNIKSNFGCSGVAEYTGTANLPTEIDLPNGQKYLITYEATPGFAGYITGRIQRVTLPTGGYYEYDYSGANDSINCSDATVTQMNRVMNDGTNTSTWQFSRSFDGTNWNTTVTAPQLPYDSVPNQSVFTFNTSAQELSEKYYQGSTAGTLLRTVNATWASNGTPATRTTILADGSTQSQAETTFDSNGNLLTLKEHDWGSGAPGTVLRTTNWTYLADSAYTANNIINRVTRVTVSDSTGTVKSRTDIAYDESGYVNSTCITGAVQHDDANYGCTYTTRGNPTTVTTYTDPVTPSGAIVRHMSYDSLGNLRTATDPLSHSVTYGYTDAWSTTTCAPPSGTYAYVTSVSNALSQVTSKKYDPCTGMLASVTDPNNQTTSFSYDSMLRPAQTNFPDGGQTLSLIHI